jgi:hypothetical protein
MVVAQRRRALAERRDWCGGCGLDFSHHGVEVVLDGSVKIVRPSLKAGAHRSGNRMLSNVWPVDKPGCSRIHSASGLGEALFLPRFEALLPRRSKVRCAAIAASLLALQGVRLS